MESSLLLPESVEMRLVVSESSEVSESDALLSSASHCRSFSFFFGCPPLFLLRPVGLEELVFCLEEVAWTDVEVPPDCCLGLAA